MRKGPLRNWDLARGLKLAFALMFLAAGILDQELLAYAAAALFGSQAVFNVGCGATTCAPKDQHPRSIKGTGNEIAYEEIR